MFASRRFTFSVVASLVVAAMSAACSGSGGGGIDPNANAQPPVPPVALTKIEVVTTGTASPPAVPVGVAYQLKAIGTYSDGTTADVTEAVAWASSDEAVATVASGAGVGGVVTPKAAGATAEVSATDAATGFSDSVTLTVLPSLTTDPGVPQIGIVPDGASILIGTTLQLQALATLDDYSTVDFSTFANLVWTSSDETVATVSSTGLVTAAAAMPAAVPPSTTITVLDPISQLTASTTVQVTDVLTLSFVGLSRGSVIGGGAVQVTGTVYLTANAVDPVTITLSTNNPAVQVPATVVIEPGQSRAQFAVTTSEVSHRTRVTISATDGTTSKLVRLNVRVKK